MSAELPNVKTLVEVLDNLERQGQSSIVTHAAVAYLELLGALATVTINPDYSKQETKDCGYIIQNHLKNGVKL